MALELSSLVPGVVSLVVNVLANPANRWGVTFLAASLTASFAVLRPRKRRREQLYRDAAAKAEPLLPHQILTQEDLVYVEKARNLVATIPPPIHSGFLVAACITYVDEDGTIRAVLGVNSETCVLPSAICAERCALLQVGRRGPDDFACGDVWFSQPADRPSWQPTPSNSYGSAPPTFAPSAASTLRRLRRTAPSSRPGCSAARCCRSTLPTLRASGCSSSRR